MKHATMGAGIAANEMFFQEQKTNLGVRRNPAAKNKSTQHTGASKLRGSQTMYAVDMSTYIMCGSTLTPPHPPAWTKHQRMMWKNVFWPEAKTKWNQ